MTWPDVVALIAIVGVIVAGLAGRRSDAPTVEKGNQEGVRPSVPPPWEAREGGSGIARLGQSAELDVQTPPPPPPPSGPGFFPLPSAHRFCCCHCSCHEHDDTR